jgi:hypothetical protein
VLAIFNGYFQSATYTYEVSYGGNITLTVNGVSSTANIASFDGSYLPLSIVLVAPTATDLSVTLSSNVTLSSGTSSPGTLVGQLDIYYI